jgi:hypothetical protein
MKDKMDNALTTLVLNTLIDMEDIDDVACYGFKMRFKVGKVFRVKGVVKVEIDDIEEVE